MLGSFLSGLLIFIVGYVYPAYECYKTVELNKPEIEKLRSWCQYWILIAFIAVVEKFADFFVSWLPLYCEAKLALYIFLWYPNLKGSSYFYETFFRPCISKYETDIDRHLLELKARATDIMLICLQKASNYGRSSIFEMLKNVALMAQTPFQQAQQPQKSKKSQEPQQPQEPQQEQRSPPPAPPTPRPSTPRPQAQFSPVKKRVQEQPRKGPTQNTGNSLLQEARARLSSKSLIQPHQSIPEEESRNTN